MDASAFWYIDGEPTKGCWVDMDEDSDTEIVLEALAESGVFYTESEHQAVADGALDEEEEETLKERAKQRAEEYGGDLLVADAEGLAAAFMGRYGSFDWDGFQDAARWRVVLPTGEDGEEIVKAYMDHFGGPFDARRMEDVYCGEWKDQREFAEHLADDLGYLDQMPDGLRFYFDYDAFARDLFLSDYVAVDSRQGIFAFRND